MKLRKKGLTDKTLLTTHVAGDSAGRAAHPDLRGGGHGDPGAERGQLHRDPPHRGLSSSEDMVTVHSEAIWGFIKT